MGPTQMEPRTWNMDVITSSLRCLFLCMFHTTHMFLSHAQITLALPSSQALLPVVVFGQEG